MTETVPEQVWLYEGPDGRDWTECEVFGQPPYVPATALEAAQARIARRGSDDER